MNVFTIEWKYLYIIFFSLQVAALRFGGWPTDKDYIKQSQKLYTLLKKEGNTPKYDHYYTVGYSGPHQRKNRRQEVWDILEMM